MTLSIARDFSISRTPFVVAEACKKICSVLNGRQPQRLFFDHSGLVDFELPAEAVLDVITREVRGRAIRTGRSLKVAGHLPTDPVAQRFIRGIGISRHMDDPVAKLSEAEEKQFQTFQQHKRTPTPKNALAHKDEKTRATQEFANFVNDCLRSVKRTLTPGGRKRLCEYTGEIIDNAEQHADTNYWYIAGYLDTSGHEPLCEIAIFNFGRTFAQTFTELPVHSYALTQVMPYIEKHRGLNWFGSGWNEEDLYTLVALQGGISSKSASKTDTRGHGTTDLIRFFQHVYSECGGKGQPPKMTLWSGATHITFDGNYKLAPGPDGRMTIAFNAANSLAEKPDSAYVKHLDNAYFPGSIVGIKFTLPPSATAPSSGNR